MSKVKRGSKEEQCKFLSEYKEKLKEFRIKSEEIIKFEFKYFLLVVSILLTNNIYNTFFHICANNCFFHIISPNYTNND